MTSPARKSSEGVVGDHFSQTRIKELEQQVADLKKRLDELRKAKNTTIIKKDKEYISTGTPNTSPIGASTGSPGLSDYHREKATFSDTAPPNKRQEGNAGIKELQEIIASLKELHRAELEELKKEVENQARQSDLNLAAELEKLKLENEELREETELLRTKETELQLQVDNLLEELSRKEAEWCSKEEKLMLEIKTSWGQKYQKWMAQTEQKIEELQVANDFLKRALQEKNNPGMN